MGLYRAGQVKIILTPFDGGDGIFQNVTESDAYICAMSMVQKLLRNDQSYLQHFPDNLPIHAWFLCRQADGVTAESP